MDLILFDLDNTLLCGDSDYEWAQFLIDKNILNRNDYEEQNKKFYKDYVDGTLDIFEFLDFQLRPLAQFPRSELNKWHMEFMDQRIRPMITQAARDLVDEHRGELIAIVTATNSFVTRPIADEFDIKYLVATEPEVSSGEFTGRVVGQPSFREGKVSRVQDWLDSLTLSFEGFSNTIFYSDSINDLPLLQWVRTPIVVNPDAQLLAHARHESWKILNLHA